MKDDIIENIRNFYKSSGSLEETKKHFNLSWRTVKKYIGPSSNRVEIDRKLVLRIFRATGSLNSTAKICNCSRTQVWRILKKNNIKVGNGCNDWKGLYNTLRARVFRSKWRKRILERDNFTCIFCGNKSRTVHHIKKLSDIRDIILQNNPSIDPFNSYQDLRKFTDLFMNEHNKYDGITLCTECHNKEHSKI